MKSHWTSILAIGAALSATSLPAHPGHGTTPPESPTHYLLEPLHVTPVLALLAVIAVALVVHHRRRVR